MTDRPSSQELESISQLQNEQRFEEALERAASLKVTYPQSHHVHKWMAHVHEAMKNLNEAIREISEAMALAPGEPDYHFNRARWHLDLGHYDDAVADCTRAIGIEMSLRRTYYLGTSYFIRALARTRLGDERGALDDCQHVADDMVFWALGELQSRKALTEQLRLRIEQQ
jgi:tetratricopeptide (TPR) repeat protein